MTKGDLLRILGPLPLATEVVFVTQAITMAGEFDPTHAYLVGDAPKPVLLLIEGEASEAVREEYYYEQFRQVWP